MGPLGGNSLTLGCLKTSYATVGANWYRLLRLWEQAQSMMRPSKEHVEQAPYLYRDERPCLAGLGRWTGTIANAPLSAASLLTRLAP